MSLEKRTRKGIWMGGAGLGALVVSLSLLGTACSREAIHGVASVDSGEVPLLEMCARLQRSAATGDAENFLADGERFVSTEHYLEELLLGLDNPSATIAELDQLTGALDFAMRLLAEDSTVLCPELAEHSEEYVDRILHSLLTVHPSYTRAMLTRWSSWGYLQDRHAQLLVNTCLLPQVRTISLRTLAGLRTQDVLNQDDYLILEQVSQDGMLCDADRESLARIRLGRGDLSDVQLMAELVEGWVHHDNPWGLIGYLIENVERRETAEQVIEVLMAWPESSHWPALEAFPGANEVVTELAVRAFFEQESVREASVCLALGFRNRAFLETVADEAPSLVHQTMAIEGLARLDDSLKESVSRASRFLDRNEFALANSKSNKKAFMSLLRTLVTLAGHRGGPAVTQDVDALLAASRRVYSAETYNASFEGLHTVLHLVEKP